MIGIIIFLIFIIAVFGYIYIDTKEKQEENYINYILNSLDDNNEMESQESIETQIQKLNKNINILQRQNKILIKTNKNIESNIGCITFIICVPVVIGVIIVLLSILAGNNILKNLNDTTGSTSVYVTDQNGNIIEDEEYHGQDVNNSNLDTYYDTDYQNN